MRWTHCKLILRQADPPRRGELDADKSEEVFECGVDGADVHFVKRPGFEIAKSRNTDLRRNLF